MKKIDDLVKYQDIIAALSRCAGPSMFSPALIQRVPAGMKEEFAEKYLDGMKVLSVVGEERITHRFAVRGGRYEMDDIDLGVDMFYFYFMMSIIGEYEIDEETRGRLEALGIKLPGRKK